MRGLHCTLLATIATTVPLAIAQAQFVDQGATSADFTVTGIRIEGLQRVTEGTVYNYLPVNIGDRLSAARVREAVRALYATGFFRDVQMSRDGGALIVVVLERPSIESFEITGNKDIKTEDLQKSLRNVGLATGKTFDRSVLEDVKQYLTDQYFSRGKYAVQVDATVEEKAGNQVKVKIDVKEGKRARIRQINLVGNQQYLEKEILESFELKTPNWLSWYKQNDRYSRESLQGDLEKLRSFYMDRGYANFQITSTQVAIAPEKDDIFITVNLEEGEVFKLSDVKIAGTFVVPEADLRRLLITQKGQTFSRKLITATQELLQNRLGEDGYAFAKVEPVPTPNNDSHEVALTYFIDPGNRVYVRNITFSGTNKINDEVLRREMRQLEGGWLSNVAVERSKQRIQRLPYVKDVEFETTPVPGSADLVDVDFKVEDGPSAQLGGGVGYSESQSFILNGSFVDSNFMGGGERVALELNTGRYSKVYSISHTNPYVTMDEVGRTFSLSYADVSQLTSSYSEFSTKSYRAGLDYSWPISETQSIRFGASLQHAELATVTSSAQQLQDWVSQNGDPFKTELGTVDILGTRFNLLELNTGWVRDSRNRTLFPTKGSAHRFLVSSTIPGSPIEFVTTSYQWQQYFRLPLPLLNRIPFSIDTRVSYAAPFGKTTAVPPNRHYFLGGPDSVRGFGESTLGPRDTNTNPYGGDAAWYGQFEAIMPLPAKFQTSARVSLFYDFGQSFYLGDTKFYNKAGFPVDYGFDLKEMRSSVGVGVEWLAPLGLFRFSFAFPLRYRDETALNYGDEIERFQFSIGQAF